MKNITITRRLNMVLSELENEFRAMCDVRDFEHQIQEVKMAKPSERPSQLRKLFDMFDMCKIPYERGKSNDYYEQIIKNAEIPSFQEIEDRMMLTLFERFEKYPSPEEYMKRIVDRLSEDTEWETDTLRLRILKQFIKYGNYLTKARIPGRQPIKNHVEQIIGHKPTDEDVISYLTDDVFNELIKVEQEPDKQKRKEKRKQIELLKVADDLATGKFRTGGATKKYLYLFAIVYNMTYFAGNGANGEMYNSETDIEKNLFTDYYANNLIRFISEAYQGKLREYDLNPSGQGINYKNYAEMVYLYYISKQGYSREDKIKLANEMIDEIRKSQLSPDSESKKEKTLDTIVYRGYMINGIDDDLYSEDILSKSEEEFKEFLIRHYDCNTYDGSYESNGKIKHTQIGAMQLHSEQKSAYNVYLDLINKLNKDECNYGLYITDVAAFAKNKFSNFYKNNSDIDKNKFENFMKVLEQVDSFLKNIFNETPESVTRTSIIGAYYYIYNAEHEDDAYNKPEYWKKEKRYWKNFADLFADFQSEVNTYLEKAFYQPLNGRNLFDIITVFSIYAYLNI